MLARWGLGLCLDHQYVCQGDEHAGPLERKLQRVPKVATRFANCQLPIGREEHRESLCSLILCTQVRSEAWYSLLITTTMDSNAYTMHRKLPGRDFLFGSGVNVNGGGQGYGGVTDLRLDPKRKSRPGSFQCMV